MTTNKVHDATSTGRDACAVCRGSDVHRDQPADGPGRIGGVEDAQLRRAQAAGNGEVFAGGKQGMREPIVNMKAILTEQQLTVLRLKYVDGLTQQEIAGMVGLDQSTVSRLIAAAMGRLREEKNIILDLSA